MQREGMADDIVHREDTSEKEIKVLGRTISRGLSFKQPRDSDSGNISLMETSHGVIDSLYEEDLITGSTYMNNSQATSSLIVEGKQIPTTHQEQKTSRGTSGNGVSPEFSYVRECTAILSGDTRDNFSENGLSDYAAKLNLDIVPLMWSFDRLLHSIPVRDTENKNKKDFFKSYSILLKSVCGKIINLVDSLVKLGQFHDMHRNNIKKWTNDHLFNNFETTVFKAISKTSIDHLNELCHYMEGINDNVKGSIESTASQITPIDISDKRFPEDPSDATQFPRTRWIPRGTQKIWYHDPNEILAETSIFRIPVIEKTKTARLQIDPRKGLLTPSSTPDSLKQESMANKDSYIQEEPLNLVQEKQVMSNTSFDIQRDGQTTSTPSRTYSQQACSDDNADSINFNPSISIKEEVSDSQIDCDFVFQIYNDRAPDAMVQPSSSGSIIDSRTSLSMTATDSNVTHDSHSSVCSEVPSLNISLSSDSDINMPNKLDMNAEIDSKHERSNYVGISLTENTVEPASDSNIRNMLNTKTSKTKTRTLNKQTKLTLKKPSLRLSTRILGKKSSPFKCKSRFNRNSKPQTSEIISTVGNVIYGKKNRERKRSKRKDGAVLAPVCIEAHTRQLRNAKKGGGEKTVEPICQQEDKQMPCLSMEVQNSTPVSGNMQVFTNPCPEEEKIIDVLTASSNEIQMPELTPTITDEKGNDHHTQPTETFPTENAVEHSDCDENKLQDLQGETASQTMCSDEVIPAPKVRVLLQRMGEDKTSQVKKEMIGEDMSTEECPDKSQPLSSQMIDSAFYGNEKAQSIDTFYESRHDIFGGSNSSTSEVVNKPSIVLNTKNLKSLLVKAVSNSRTQKANKTNQLSLKSQTSKHDNWDKCEGETSKSHGSSNNDFVPPTNNEDDGISNQHLADKTQNFNENAEDIQESSNNATSSEYTAKTMSITKVETKDNKMDNGFQKPQLDFSILPSKPVDISAKMPMASSFLSTNKIHDPKDVYNVLRRLQESETYIYIMDNEEASQRKKHVNTRSCTKLKKESHTEKSNSSFLKVKDSSSPSRVINTVFTEDMPVMVVGRENQKNFMTFGQLVSCHMSMESNNFASDGDIFSGNNSSESLNSFPNETISKDHLYVNNQKWVPLNMFQVKMATGCVPPNQSISESNISSSLSSSISLPYLSSSVSDSPVESSNLDKSEGSTPFTAGIECKVDIPISLDQSKQHSGLLHIPDSLRDIFTPELSNHSSEELTSPSFSCSEESIGHLEQHFSNATASVKTRFSSSCIGKSSPFTQSSLSSHEIDSRKVISDERSQSSKSSEMFSESHHSSPLKRRPNVTHNVRVKMRKLSHNTIEDYRSGRVDGDHSERPLLFPSTRSTYNSKVAGDDRPAISVSQLEIDIPASGKNKPIDKIKEEKTTSSDSGVDEASSEPSSCDLQDKKKTKFSKKDFVISPDEIVSSTSRRGFRYKELCLTLVNDVYNHSKSDPFRHEVKSEELPQYYKIIKYPMCLDVMAFRLRNLTYTNLETFVSDMRRIFWNWKLYYTRLSSRHGLAVTERVLRFFNAKLERALPDMDFSHISGSPQHCKNEPNEEPSRRSKRRTGGRKNEGCKVSIPYELKQLLG